MKRRLLIYYNNYLKWRQREDLMKASLVGFIICNGLNGPSASHLILNSNSVPKTTMTQLEEKIAKLYMIPGLGNGGEFSKFKFIERTCRGGGGIRGWRWWRIYRSWLRNFRIRSPFYLIM